MKHRYLRIAAVVLCLGLLLGVAAPLSAAVNSYVKTYNKNYPQYLKQEMPIVDSFRASYRNTLANSVVGRAIWYMQNGYMVYGHTKYAATGRIDCSNFVSLVYKDFGYKITSAARNYGSVGVQVQGVYSRLQAGSTKRYELVGVDKLKPGDIMTFWKKDSAGRKYIGHVAIYMGKINGKPCIIQTCSGRPTAIGITNSFTWWYGEHFNGARRVLPASAYNYTSTLYKNRTPVIPTSYVLPPQKKIVLPARLAKGF